MGASSADRAGGHMGRAGVLRMPGRRSVVGLSLPGPGGGPQWLVPSPEETAGAARTDRVRDRTARVAMFLVVRVRSGPEWDAARPLEEQEGWDEHAAFMDRLVDDGFVVLGGPLADEHRVALVIEAESEGVVNATLGRDPWTGSHLVTDAVEPWTIRLDGRSR